MAEVLIPTPVDETTRLPLQIAPKCEYLPRHNSAVADEHHGEHPSGAEEMQIPILGPAVRNLQLRIVERDLHNEGPFRYHHGFGGPWLPRTYEEGYGLCIPGVAGFISRQVIDMQAFLENGKKAYVRDATPDEWEFLRTPGGIQDVPFDYRYVYHNLPLIREFFIYHLGNQDLQSYPTEEIEEFLTTMEDQRRAELGQTIIKAAIEASLTQDIIDTYTQAYANEQLHPNAPSTAGALVGTIIGIEPVSLRVAAKLSERLRVQFPDIEGPDNVIPLVSEQAEEVARAATG